MLVRPHERARNLDNVNVRPQQDLYTTVTQLVVCQERFKTHANPGGLRVVILSSLRALLYVGRRLCLSDRTFYYRIIGLFVGETHPQRTGACTTRYWGHRTV